MNIPSIVLSLGVAIIAVAFGVLTLMGWLKTSEFLALEETRIRNQAIDGCAQNSKYIHTENNGAVTDVFEEPNQGLYIKCLELKGINTDQQ